MTGFIPLQFQRSWGSSVRRLYHPDVFCSYWQQRHSSRGQFLS